MADYSVLIEAIRARSDLLSVISSCVTVKKTGKSYQGLCPFHPEKTPSFHVYPEKQRFHCYGCQKDGDIFSFLQNYHGLSFLQVLQKLAEDLHLEHLLSQSSTMTLTPAQKSHTQQLKSAVYEAMKFFEDCLKNLPDSHSAKKMLEQRKIKDTIIQRYNIGWSGGFSSVLDRFPEKKEYLFQAGLITPVDRGRSWNRFVDRLVFPIFTVNPVEPVGFGGRIVETNTDNKYPKYLNSPESELFLKSRLLYGLHIALEQRLFKSFVIVEGYFDVLQMANHGLPCAVAPMGTAIGLEHLKKLLSYRKELIFCFDGDKAGQDAAYKVLTLLLPLYTHKLQASFVTLPAEHDPDSFLLMHGREKFINLLQKRVKIGEYLFQSLQKSNPLNGIDNTVIFVAQAKKLIRTIEDPDARMTLLRVLDAHTDRPQFKAPFFKRKDTPSLKAIPSLDWLAAILATQPQLTKELSFQQKELLKKSDAQGRLKVFFQENISTEDFEKEILKICSQNHALLSLIPSDGLKNEMYEQLKLLGIMSE